tara:strand:- start:8694 stop:9194 length:501 start_codon:yes stop_codon:yes gene_type:complete
MSFIKTTFITKNNVGTISKITKDIFKNGINIERSQMITKDNILIYNVESDYRNRQIMNDIFNKHNCHDLTDLNTNNNFNIKNYYNKNIKLTCFDDTGVIHSSSDVLNNLKIDINTLISDSENAPMTASKVFNLTMNVNIPNHIDDYVIKKSFEPVINKYNIELNID